jgi:hypothetical protein
VPEADGPVLATVQDQRRYVDALHQVLHVHLEGELEKPRRDVGRRGVALFDGKAARVLGTGFGSEDVAQGLGADTPVRAHERRKGRAHVGRGDVEPARVTAEEHQSFDALRMARGQSHGGRRAARDGQQGDLRKGQLVDHCQQGRDLVLECEACAISIAEPGAGPVVAHDGETGCKLGEEVAERGIDEVASDVADPPGRQDKGRSRSIDGARDARVNPAHETNLGRHERNIRRPPRR